MKKSAINWSIQQMNKMHTVKGSFRFDYPVQRESGQWNKMQQSLIIHSFMDDYPVPAIYGIQDEEKYYSILDGKQRLTNIFAFINNEFPLHEGTPNVHLNDIDEVHEVAGKTFHELNEDVQQSFLGSNMTLYKIEEATDEELEELFFRLNNGTPLSKEQKLRSRFGMKVAEHMDKLLNHNLITEKSAFTPRQRQQAQHEATILQTMMLVDRKYEMKNFGNVEIGQYADTIRDDNSRMKLMEGMEEVFDYLAVAFEKKATFMLKKMNFPMTVYVAYQAMQEDIAPEDFQDWAKGFKKEVQKENKEEQQSETAYKQYTGSGGGSTKYEKVVGRIQEMDKHFTEHFAFIVNDSDYKYSSYNSKDVETEENHAHTSA